MPEPDRRTDQDRLLDDICPIHKTAMVRTQLHVGDGKVKWSDPSCVLCEQLKTAGKYDDVKAAVEAEDKQRAERSSPPASAAAARQEQPGAAPVKSDAPAPAAKT